MGIWKELGYFPFTRQLLQDRKVKHEIVVLEDGTIDVDADPMTEVLLKYEEENEKAVRKLNAFGFNGNEFLKKAPKVDTSKNQIAVTERGSVARWELINDAKAHGNRFVAT